MVHADQVKDKIMTTEAITQIQHISYILYACMYCKNRGGESC